MSTIKANTITAADLDTDVTITGNGTGVPNLETGSKLNGVAFGTAATLNVGTGANQIVQLDGSGNLPAVNGSALTNLPATGWEFVSKTSASDVAQVDFTGFTSGYDYQIVAYEIYPATDGQQWHGRVGTGAGPTYDTGANYSYATSNFQGPSTHTGSADGAGALIPLIGITGYGNNVTQSANMQITIYNPADTSTKTHGFSIGHGTDNTGNSDGAYCGWKHNTVGAVTAFRIFAQSGNITAGEFFLYRRANA